MGAVRRYRQRPGPTGAALAAARKAAGLSQASLAARAGIGRDAVCYWEAKPCVDPRSWAVQRMAEAEPRIAALLQDFRSDTRGRGMGLSMMDFCAPPSRAQEGTYQPWPIDRFTEVAIAAERSRMLEREADRQAKARVICGAKTTRKGTPCRNKGEPGKRRCKFHGGKSTGPKTAEGKTRIAEAQRRRWEAYRAGLP